MFWYGFDEMLPNSVLIIECGTYFIFPSNAPKKSGNFI